MVNTDDVCFDTCVCCVTCYKLSQENAELKRQVTMFAHMLDKRGLEVPSTSTVALQTDYECEDETSVEPVPPNLFELSPSQLSISDQESDITSSSSSHSLSNLTSVNTERHELIEAFTPHTDRSFKQFSLDNLQRDTKFDTGFRSRLVAYYGDEEYHYSGKRHVPQPFKNNQTLCDIIAHVRKTLPRVKFNSAMVTLYKNGSQHIPYHSDDEPDICESSEITTISFGQTRVIKFRSIDRTDTRELPHVLSHGDVFTMTKSSQKHFQHCIPKDYSTLPRISVTLREIINPINEITTFLEELGSPEKTPSHVAPAESSIYNSPKVSLSKNMGQISSQNQRSLIPQTEKPITLYLSSSMFRRLNAEKLSSRLQQAEVFSYPGATAGMMLEKFQQDPRLRKLNTQRIQRVIILTGTNNVDRILFENPQEQLDRAQKDIYSLMQFVHAIAPTAFVNFLNILPRHNMDRNIIINELNSFFIFLSNEVDYVNFIDTGHGRYLFSTADGFRKGIYFTSATRNIPDNPHLNNQGVGRLAKHLKYIAHNC